MLKTGNRWCYSPFKSQRGIKIMLMTVKRMLFTKVDLNIEIQIRRISQEKPVHQWWKDVGKQREV